MSHVQRTQLTVAELNAGPFTQATITEVMLWTEKRFRELPPYLPMAVENFFRVSEWVDLRADNGWDWENAAAMWDLAKRYVM